MTFYRQKLPVLDSSEAAFDHLVAVSKNQSGSRVRLAYAMGQRHFGESYVQELTAKRAELADLRGVTWHFIGRIQSNKIEALATCADVIHSLEDAAKAKALAAACSRVGRATPMQVFIKPELSNLTPAASGCSWETARELGTFLRDNAKHNGPLLWKGFMGIAPLGASETETERLFEEFMLRGKELWSSLCPDATQPNFSLGMSQDAPLARRVAAKLGLPPTVLRLGTSIFGERG
jgi:pyridoxal phosphate enzyme (YggS family)